MNCRLTRDLISAYSDQELTGREMLEIGEHLRQCADCAREWREINEIRSVLRHALFHQPPAGAEQQLFDRVMAPEEPAWSTLLSALLGPDSPSGRVPRGRRLATALALSSLAVLAMANPFAPQSRDAASGTGGIAATVPPMSASMLSFPALTWGLPFLPAGRMAALTSPAPDTPASAPATPAPPAMGADQGPLRDVTMADYMQSREAWNVANAADPGLR